MIDIWNVNPNDYIKIVVERGEAESLQYRTDTEPVELKRAERVRIDHEFQTALRKTKKPQ